VLDTRTISNFTNGMYLVWNISGHVKINVTWISGPNAVVSGVFFGGSSETVSISPQSVSLSAGQQQQFTATVTATSNQAVSWSISSVTPANAASGSISTTGLYKAPATITPAQVTVKATSADGTASGVATVNLIIASVANFVSSDTSTRGNWHGVYGADGYSVANDTQSIPSYASFAVQNQGNWTWAASTADVRALQNGANTGRIAATWYTFNPAAFTFDVNFTDGNAHRFALYAVDWDNAGRNETIQILDANTNGVLDTRTISNFTNGMYLVWNISGHVKINVTWISGPNAVVSGVFFQ
jgi:Bacterial Ig-like domain (group 2)